MLPPTILWNSFTLQVISAEPCSLILLPRTVASLSLKLDPVIVSDPPPPPLPTMVMAPPFCQKHKNKTIEAAVSEIVRKYHLKNITQQG
jgi:hypothetical protein